MATFKVGDRVRIVGGKWFDPAIKTQVEGRTGTVRGTADAEVDDMPYAVEADGFRAAYADGLFRFAAHHLAPLTPPAEDTWAADKVRQVTKPQHIEPVVPERIHGLA